MAEENNNLCGNTYTAEYSPTEPCEQVSTDCVIYEGSLPELSLNDNPGLTSIINTIVSSLVNVTSSNNIIPRFFGLGYFSSGFPVSLIASVINNLQQPIVVNSTNIMFFNIFIGEYNYVYTFDGIGKGTYGSNATPVSASDFQRVSKQRISYSYFQQETNTDEIVFANDISPNNISQYVNNLSTPIDIKPTFEGNTVFKVNISGDNVMYLYIGDSGITGLGEHQTDINDFLEIPETPTENVLQGYRVTGLPSGEEGQIAYVTDADSITYRATATGGGTEKALVFFDGTNWIYH